MPGRTRRGKAGRRGARPPEPSAGPVPSGEGRAPAAAGACPGAGKAGGHDAGGKEGLPKVEVAGLLSSVEDLDRRIEESREILDGLAAQLGALARLSLTNSGSPEAVVPRLVEMHVHISSLHHSLEDSFESVRTRYAALRERCAAITGECSREIEERRKNFEELWRKMEGAGPDPARLLTYLKEENELFSRALDSYNLVLGTVSTMRDVDNRVSSVFNDFSETIGRMDGISRTMGEFMSTNDDLALEEELQSLRRSREERVGRYIR